MTYRAIATTETDPQAPLTAALLKALESNPTDIAAGGLGAPKVVGEALDIILASADTTLNTPIGWADLDRAEWLEIFGAFILGATNGAVEARLSSNNGATWSSYSSLSGSVGSTTAGSFRIQINIKTGAWRYIGRTTAGADSFTSGTLALTGVPNALQLRMSVSNATYLKLDAKVIGGIA